jgi:Txe/YoeB family toxin of Txe-Axe toxin-antitoxin module
VSYPVEVLDEVKHLDMPELVAIDPRLGRVVAEIVRELHADPWLGREMRERRRMEVLKDCRKVLFDLPSRKGKPRFRLVYRNDPSDGSIALIAILAVGPRSDLQAYRRAVTRLGRRDR